MFSAFHHFPILAQFAQNMPNTEPVSHAQLGLWVLCSVLVVFGLERGMALWQRIIGGSSFATRAEFQKMEAQLEKMRADQTKDYNTLMTSEARGRSVLHEKLNAISGLVYTLNGKFEMLLDCMPGLRRRMPKLTPPAHSNPPDDTPTSL